MARKTSRADRPSEDKDLAELAFSTVCVWCTHWEPSILGRYCAAFPRSSGKQIPDAIWMAKNNHVKPYPGDHGVQFEPAPEGIETMKRENPALAKAWAEKEARGGTPSVT
jgi:hypothetical protein